MGMPQSGSGAHEGVRKYQGCAPREPEILPISSSADVEVAGRGRDLRPAPKLIVHYVTGLQECILDSLPVRYNKTKLGVHQMTLARPFLAVSALLAMSGCASITGSKMQPVSVQTIQDNKEVAGVGCTLVNDAGKWFVTSPGSVTIQKSTADLAVTCNKDNQVVGSETIVSKANGSVWGNIVAGGIIGYAVDRSTGAGFDYPQMITVMLRKVGEAVGISTPAPINTAQSDTGVTKSQ